MGSKFSCRLHLSALPRVPVPIRRVLLLWVAFSFLCVFITLIKQRAQVLLAPGFGSTAANTLPPQAIILKPKFTSRQIADYRAHTKEGASCYFCLDC